MHEKKNIVVIILDTLRARDVGCYGNEHIHTPHMDALARRGTCFTHAFPESLPTIPVRRALHTGRRAYPFRNYRHMKWGTVTLPGWQPISEEEDTLAENLAAAGYQTGFVCTTQHCWNPGFNFHRGFRQWELVRGYSGEDRWGSPYSTPRHLLKRYGDPEDLMKHPHRGQGAPMVLANRGTGVADCDTPTAQAFQWASRFLKDNREVPFYLLIDSFAPHEPWEAPDRYYRMYCNPEYNGTTHFSATYGPADSYSDEEVHDMKAHYRGLVTHVDHWLGLFLFTMDSLGLSDNTAVLLVSDHGTNFCENPRNVIGKPADSMYPAVMNIPLIACLGGGNSEGNVCDEIVYNLDISATAYDLADSESPLGISGQSLRPLCASEDGWKPRSYITCRYGNSLCYADDTVWALADISGNYREIFDLTDDPECRSPLPQEKALPLWKAAWKRLLDDAGGELPDCSLSNNTDALGRC